MKEASPDSRLHASWIEISDRDRRGRTSKPDQIFNLSVTWTATKTLLAPGVRGVIEGSEVTTARRRGRGQLYG
jgi:hypothetical protein